MMTLELDDETASLLNALAEQEHIKPAQLLKAMLLEHSDGPQDTKPVLLTEIIKTLPDLPSFQGDPLEIQKAMRDEWD